jgi:GNAT superfamily N-acetyltransferase
MEIKELTTQGEFDEFQSRRRAHYKDTRADDFLVDGNVRYNYETLHKRLVQRDWVDPNKPHEFQYDLRMLGIALLALENSEQPQINCFGKELLGYYLLRFGSDKGNEVWEMGWVHSLPQYKGKRIGLQLIDEMARRLKGYGMRTMRMGLMDYSLAEKLCTLGWEYVGELYGGLGDLYFVKRYLGSTAKILIKLNEIKSHRTRI